MVNNQGWVSVGIDHDTAQFAVETHPSLVARHGPSAIPRGQRAADHGRRRGQQWSSDTAVEGRSKRWPTNSDLTLIVCHFPPGTSKWNKIEHRLFSFITQNWRGRPLVSLEAIVSLIAKTTTKTGLTVKAALDTNPYQTAIKVTDEELAGLQLQRHEFHGDWNYTISPRRK